MYCLNLLAIALELASEDPAYEDVASKFWEHFLYIANAINHLGSDGAGMWDEEDGFFYDVLHMPDGGHLPLKVRSMVGLIPLFAVETLEPQVCRQARRLQAPHGMVHRQPPATSRTTSRPWTRPARASAACCRSSTRDQLRRILKLMLDENEFLSPFGIRALSRVHQRPSVHSAARTARSTAWTTSPAESTTGLFGGNSNWRGPVWFPLNYLLIESLQKFHHYLGDDFKVECPTGSGQHDDAVGSGRGDLAPPDAHLPEGRDGRRPVHGAESMLSRRPALAGPGAVLRILPRRQRRGRRAPATRPAGRALWPSCCSRAASELPRAAEAEELDGVLA